MKRAWAIADIQDFSGVDVLRIAKHLKTAGISIEPVSLENLMHAPSRMAAFRGVIYPYGDEFPLALYEPLRKLHASGCDICWLGGVPFRRPVVRHNGKWSTDMLAELDAIPCWLHLLHENIGSSTWCTLIEQWGLYYDPLTVPADMLNIECAIHQMTQTSGFKDISGTVGPLEPGMNFRSLMSVHDTKKEYTGSVAYCAAHTRGIFKGAKIGGTLYPVAAFSLDLITELIRSFDCPLGFHQSPAGMAPCSKPRHSEGFPQAGLVAANKNDVTLVINGKQSYPLMYEFEITHRCLRKSIPNMFEAGIRIFKPNFNLFPCWLGPDRYDFRLFDYALEQVLSAAPASYLMPHISLLPGHWWYLKHPDQLRINDFPISLSLRDCSAATLCNSPVTPSIASELWKSQIKQAFSALIDHVGKSWYSRRFLGIHVAYGFCGEWIESAWCNNQWALGDWHPAAIQQFQRYAARFPRWKTQNASVPHRLERMRTDQGFFIDPSRQHLAPLWYKFLSQRTAKLLDEITTHIKRKSKGKLLTGAFGGYFFQAGRCAYLHADAISWAISNYLPLKHLDMLEAPHGYDGRDMEHGDCTLRGIPELLAAHKKLFIDQNDQRTHREHRSGEMAYGHCCTPRDSAEHLKRNLASAIVRKGGFSWFDFGLGWFDDARYLKTVRQFAHFAHHTANEPIEHLDGLGIVIDDNALFYQRMANNLIHRLMYQQKNLYFNRMGVPWYIYHINDLLSGRIRPVHKVWLFLNIFHLAPSQRKHIRRLFCRNNRTLIWLYAPGFQSPAGLSTAGITELTGMNVKMADVAASGQITVTNCDDPVTKGIQKGTSNSFLGACDTDDKAGIIEPLFYVDDAQAVTLGILEAVNLPGFARRRFADHTSIYAAASQLNEVIYRNICCAAGTHVYSDSGDLIYIHPRFIAFMSNTAGAKKIYLPKPALVKDLHTGRTIAANTRELKFKAEKNVVKFFLLQ